MRSLLGVFLLSTLTLFGQTFPLSERRLGPAPWQREEIETAASDEQFLVVWTDARERSGGNEAPARAWAARVTRDGVLRDAAGLPVGERGVLFGEANIDVVSVASDGTDFLVATTRGGRLALTKVTAEGEVLPVALSANIQAAYANLVWLGNGYALFYNEFTTAGPLSTRGRALILDRDGVLLLRDDDIITSTGAIEYLNAAVLGSSALLVWTDTGDGRVHVRLASLSALRAGQVTIASELSPTRGEAHGLAIASGGGRYFVAWRDGQDYRGRVLDANGAAVSDSLLIAQSNSTGDIDVSWNGSRFVVAHSTIAGFLRTPRLALYDTAGNRTGDHVLQTPATFDLSVASSGGNSLVAWESFGELAPAERDQVLIDVHASDSLGLRYGGSGNLISTSAPTQEGPDGVWRGTHYLATWMEWSNAINAVYGRFTVGGRPLDGPGVILGETSVAPAMASDGSSALIVWGQNDSRLTLVRPDGTSTQKVLAAGYPGLAVDVAWNGEEYAACVAGTIARVGPDGTILQTAELPDRADECHLEWNGLQYVVFWNEIEGCFPICTPPSSLVGQAISKDLTLLGSAVRLAHPGVESAPESATAGDRTLVVWVDRDQGNGRLFLRGMRISQLGSVLDPSNGFVIAEADHLSDVFADGENWVVTSGPYAWTVLRSSVVGPRETRYPFIPEGADAQFVGGGPLPLMLFQAADPDGLVTRLYGSYLASIRHRAVRR